MAQPMNAPLQQQEPPQLQPQAQSKAIMKAKAVFSIDLGRY